MSLTVTHTHIHNYIPIEKGTGHSTTLRGPKCYLAQYCSLSILQKTLDVLNLPLYEGLNSGAAQLQ